MLSNVNNVSNLLQSIGLILAMVALVAVVGFTLAGFSGLVGAVLLTLFWLSAGQRVSASLILKMYRAQPIDPKKAPALFEIYGELCQRAGLDPQPRLYYIPSRMANAFAVGTGENSAVALTDGLVRTMKPREIAGILAHELTHVRCKDTSVLGIADTISRTITLFSRVGLLMMLFSFPGMDSRSGFAFLISGAILFFSPALATMLQLALSRTREFNADRGAAELTGDPLGLVSALRKLDRMGMQKTIWQKVLRPGLHRQQPAMLRTHPPTKVRVAELISFAEELGRLPASPNAFQATQRKLAPADQPRVRQKPHYHFLSGLWS